MSESPFAHSESVARDADVGPYARPSAVLTGHAIDAVLVDAIRATVGPYVPAAMRDRATRATATTPLFEEAIEGAGKPSPELPWIETFLDAEPAESVLDSPSSVASTSVTAEEPTTLAPIEASDWPLDEAGHAMRSLAEDLSAREPRTPEPQAAESAVFESRSIDGEAPVASTPPLPMWGDDDMMDIMPVKSPRTNTDSNEHWAARARRESERTGTNEAAALALESLARRVREGEISIPGYSPEMGDAAALAAALAALLSVRR